MDPESTLTMKVLATAMLVSPVLSVILHLRFKPRFWTPAFIVFASAALPLGLSMYVDSRSSIEALKAAFLFGVLFLGVGVTVGVCFRMLFREQYLRQDRLDMQSPGFALRSRVAGAAAVLMGAGLLTLMYIEGPYNAKALVGGIMFIVLGLAYLLP